MHGEIVKFDRPLLALESGPIFNALTKRAETKSRLANVDRRVEDRLTWEDEVYLSWQPAAAVVLTW